MIPGQPTIVVKNQPGAASLIATNELANVSPKDGSVIGAVFERVALEPLIHPEKAKFDGRKLNWLGSVLKGTDVCMFWHMAPAKTIDDARKEEVIVGAAGEGGNSAVAPRMLNALVGTKFKVVGGYGGAELFLAMERGETQARCGMSWGGLKATRPDWLKSGKLNIVLQLAVDKHPELQSVPLVMDMVSSQADKAALRFLYATQEMGRPYVAPPGVPADRVATLRKAFDDMVKDKVFLEEAGKSNLEIAPITGQRVHEIVTELYETPRPIIERVESLR